MDYVRLGKSGLEVSRLCLGCMTYGEPLRGPHEWTLDEAKSRPLIRQAIEAGITFFDTANVYSDGTSEEFLGRALKDFARREEVVIATKVHGRMRPGPNGGGLSRRHIFEQIDKSLKRLGVDHVDLYQIHRMDPVTPLEETLEALNDVVRAGKALYLGASSMFAWQFATALSLQDRHGWARFVSMQNHYNLLYREEEREMIPFCRAQGIGILPWSPLARGRLARPKDVRTARDETDLVTHKLYDQSAEADGRIIDAVGAIAQNRGVPRAQVGLAWLLSRPDVTAPIIGASRPSQFDDAIAAMSLALTPDELAALEAPYLPKPVAGHS